MKINRKKIKQKGMATVEALPLLVIFVMLIQYSIRMHGAVHTAILYSIHARTYAFETFRNRSSLTYFRGNIDSVFNPSHYQSIGMRLHGIHSGTVANVGKPEWKATRRYVFSEQDAAKEVGDNANEHANNINNLSKRNREVGVDPIWVRVSYGICVTPQCGD